MIRGLVFVGVGSSTLYACRNSLVRAFTANGSELRAFETHSGGVGRTYSSEWDKNWDKCGSPATSSIRKKDLPIATRNIILIRHGQYQSSKIESEKKLTVLGCEQARLTGERLKQLGFDITAVHVSTVRRALETCAVMQKSLPGVEVNESDLLREGDAVPPIPHDGIYVAPEQYHADLPRFEAAFRKYFHRAGSDQSQDSIDVIVSHANVICYFVCRALQLPPECWVRFTPQHASITWIVIRPDGAVSLHSFSDTGHFDRGKITE